jgi:hypothetical protein
VARDLSLDVRRAASRLGVRMTVTSRVLGDVVVLAHVAFVTFVVLGGLLVLRRPRVAVVHLAAVAWGVLVELAGLTCPLTPLENRLRERAGDAP